MNAPMNKGDDITARLASTAEDEKGAYAVPMRRMLHEARGTILVLRGENADLRAVNRWLVRLAWVQFALVLFAVATSMWRGA